jgi:rhamnose transport system permease protein
MSAAPAPAAASAPPGAPTRPGRQGRPGAGGRLQAVLRRWEAVLVVILVAICALNSLASPYFLELHNLFDSTQAFTEKAIIALSMSLVILGRDIDLSVASIIALCSTTIGWLATQGVGTAGLLAASVAVGAAAGAFNGFLTARLRVPAIVVTIGTMSLFRGVAYAVLGDKAFTAYPKDFWVLGQGYLFGLIPYEFLVFVLLAAIFSVVLHRTVIGRSLYAYGNNPEAALYSGIDVDAHRFWFFTVNGTLSGLSAAFLTSRIGATRPNMASGWELEVIAVVVLGGVSILGGSGTMTGVILSVFVMGMLTFGLGLLNVPGIIMSIVIGLLLILAIATPLVVRKVAARRG